MIEEHQELYILHTMASQIDSFRDSFASFETFKVELTNVLKTIFDNQNTIKQELFLIRNKQAETSTKLKPGNVTTNNDVNPVQTSQPVSNSRLDVPSSSSSTPEQPSVTFASVASNVPPKISEPAHAEPAPMILYVGDSISANVDFGALEVATQSEVVTAKAYSSIKDTVQNVAKQAAKFPASNFTEVVPAQLKKNSFKTLVLQAGSVDITNLNTKDEPTKHMEYFRQEAVKSAKNLFKVAVNALNTTPSLKKVVIMKQIPRYDPSHVDPLSLKPTLSVLFNSTLTDLWMESPYKQKIYVGNHNIECTGAIKESRYRHTKSGKYDGIHLLGSSGQKAYTLSVLSILKAANITSSDYDYHLSCAQFKYQNRQNRTNHRQPSGRRYNQKVKNNQNSHTIPTYNRFQGACNMNQGNL